MVTTGEKPGKGTYNCRNCNQIITLDENTDTMPPCPRCRYTEFN